MNEKCSQMENNFPNKIYLVPEMYDSLCKNAINDM